MATLSPMMQQYMRLKEQNPDTLRTPSPPAGSWN